MRLTHCATGNANTAKKQRSVMCGACHLGSAFDVIEQLPSAQPEPQWIPVSERLPEILTPVLVTVKVEDDYKVAHDWVYDNDKWAHYRDVVAWMPLPDPYREDDEK